MRVPNVLVSLGESSFSLYLVHIFVVAALAEAWAYCHLTTIMPAYVLGLTCFAAALAVSHLVHLQIEYPLNKWLKAAISGPASKRGLPQRGQPSALISDRNSHCQLSPLNLLHVVYQPHVGFRVVFLELLWVAAGIGTIRYEILIT